MKPTVLVILALLLSVLAFGQAWKTTAKATVPFEFFVNDVALPAGDYDVLTTERSILTLRNTRTNELVTVHTAAIILDSPAPTAKLVFRRDGDRSVLHQVFLEQNRYAFELIHSKNVPELSASR